MREPFHQLYVHLIWATWDRLPLLTPDREPSVYACIQAECVKLKADIIAIGGVENHVHLLARYDPSLSIPELVKQAKGVSSHLVTHVITPNQFFKWQGAYMAYSVSKLDVPRIRDYILRQKEHHRNETTLPDDEFPT